MRILHTSDWHLGKRLDFYSRHEEQIAVMNEICEIAEEQKADLIIVAGDLFDTFNPPIESTELLYKTLKRLAKNGKVPVIAIAGNHDSPYRVNVADVLARENGIIFIGHPTDTVPVFELEDGFRLTNSEIGFFEIELAHYDYPVRIFHTAFANEARLKEFFGEDKQHSLQESLSEKWSELASKYADNKGVNLLTTHLFVSKRGEVLPDEPEGEKPLNIGNADLIDSNAIPKEIQYTALGHLHRFQDVGVHQPVIYSGSPLSYSFAEAGQKKFVSIIDIEPNAKAKIEKIELHSGRSLHRKTFQNTDDAVEWLQANPYTLIELSMETDEFLKADDRKMLYQNHDGIIHLIPKVKNLESQSTSTKSINLEQEVDELFVDFFKSKNNGQEPNKEIMDLFNEILNN